MAYSFQASSLTPALTITEAMQVTKISVLVTSSTSTDYVSILLNGANPTGDNTNYPNVALTALEGIPYNDWATGGKYLSDTVIDFSGLGSGVANVALSQG